MRKTLLGLGVATIVASQAFTFTPQAWAISSQVAATTSQLAALGAANYSAIELIEVTTSDSVQEGSKPERSLPGYSHRSTSSASREVIDDSLRWEVEPNDNSAQAELIDPASAPLRLRGAINPAGDTDWYAFEALAGDRIYAGTMTSNVGSSSSNTFLALIASDGATIIEEDDNDGGFTTTASTLANVQIPADGTYYLRVRSGPTDLMGPYDLFVNLRRGAPVAETEPNESGVGGQPLPAGGWVSGYLSAISPTESDYYTGVTAQAGDTIVAVLDLDPDRAGGTRADGRLGIGLFGSPTPTQILVVNRVTNTGFPAPPAEAFFMTVKDAGSYTIYVDAPVAGGTGSSGSTGNYTLSVFVLPAAAPSGSCATYPGGVTDVALTNPGVTQFTLDVPDSFRIGDVDVGLRINHPFMADLDAVLISPQGTPLVLFTDVGASGPVGTQPEMNVVLDDEAIMPLTANFTAINNQRRQPETGRSLTVFDGQDSQGTWTLRIYDDLAANAGTLNEWSLSLCEAPPPPVCPAGFAEVEVYATDFEADNGGFTAAGDWARGLPTPPPATAAIGTCHDGSSNCFVTNLTGNYSVNSNANLVSPVIDLTDYVGPVTLHWAHAHQMESFTWDRLTATAQLPGGGDPSVFFRSLNTTIAQNNGGSNVGPTPVFQVQEYYGWGQFQEDLSAFAGGEVELVFNLTSDDSVTREGWAIDDIRVTACEAVAGAPEIDVSPASLTATLDIGDSDIQTLTITNNGDASLNWEIDEENTGGTCAALSDIPWLTLSAVGGDTDPGDSSDVDVTFNAASLTAGNYTGNLCVTSDDTANPLIVVPVSLTVEVPAAPQPAFFNSALTTSSPTYDSPGGSSSGSAVQYYCAQQFTVDTSGSYVIETTSPNTTGTPSDALDTYLNLYANAFDPLTPAAGLVSGNDDFTGTLTVLPGPYAGTVTATTTGFQGAQPGSRIAAAALTAGTTYILVNTSFRQTNYAATGNQGWPFGAYYTGIGGPGSVTLVGTTCVTTTPTDPEIAVAPAVLDFTVDVGDTDSDGLDITNIGGGTLEWDIVTANAEGSGSVAAGAVETVVTLHKPARDALMLDADSRSPRHMQARAAQTAQYGVSARGTPVTVAVVSPDTLAPTEIVSDLNAFPDVTATMYTGNLATITAADLQPYDVVLISNNNRWSTIGAQVTVGDALADYVDAGGKVVVFSFAYDYVGWELGGRFITEDYGPFELSTNDTDAPSTMVPVIPSHPILAGVTSLAETGNWRQNMTLTSGAELIANWADGLHLIAANDNSVAFNIMYSPSTLWTGDLPLLARNAVVWLADGDPPAAGCDNPATIPWLSVSPDNGDTGAGQTDTATVAVNATGLTPGLYEALLCVTSNDTVTPLVEVPVGLTVTAPGGSVLISVDPTALSSSQNANTVQTQTLTITNDGTSPGSFTIAETTASGGNKPGSRGGPTELYNNGPMITNPGAGPGGSDVSLTQPPSTLIGAGAQQTVPNRVAEDFTVTGSGWDIDTITFYSYQTGSSTTPTFTGVTVRIWDGVPGAGGSNVVWGDDTTNVFGSATWTGIYRAGSTTPTDTTRPLMAVVANTPVSLPPGTYWMDYALSGTLASGPWVNPVAIPGSHPVGNALQALGVGGAFNPLLDAGSATQVTLPFSIVGTSDGGGGCSAPSDIPWLSVSPLTGTVAGGGGTFDVTVSYDSTGLAPGAYNAKLCVQSDDTAGNDLIEVPVSLTVLGGGVDSSDLALSLFSVPGTVDAGGSVSIVATVANFGPSNASDVEVELELPAEFTFVSGSLIEGSGNWSCSAAGSTVTCELTTGTLPTGSFAAVLQVDADVATDAEDGTVITNGTVSSASTDPNAANNDASATTTIIAGPSDVIFADGFELAGDPDIVVFDGINFTVPATLAGGSVQWDTGATCTCDTAPHNFNIWTTGGNAAFFWPTAPTGTNGGVATGGVYNVLSSGAVIGPSSTFITDLAAAAAANWRQAANVDGYLGFRFQNPATSQINYGYVRITTTGTTGHPATIVSWAYNSAGNPITIP